MGTRSLSTQSAIAIADTKSRKSLRPLSRMLPYLMRHRTSVMAALFFLVLAAGTTLLLPQAVRQMIDHGFSAVDKNYINSYFLMLMGLAVVLALASARTILFCHHHWRADCCRYPSGLLFAPDRALTGILRSGKVGRDYFTADGRYDADQIRVWRDGLAGLAEYNFGRWGADHDGGDQPETLESWSLPRFLSLCCRSSCLAGGAQTVARGTGHAGRCYGLCERSHFRDQDVAGICQ